MSNSPHDQSHAQWFVRMKNGAIYGPVHTKGLLQWVCEGRVMPDDEISTDQVHWQSAQALDLLQMNTLIKLPDGTLMGPFHEQAIEPLIQEGRIPRGAQKIPSHSTSSNPLENTEKPEKPEKPENLATPSSDALEALKAQFEEKLEALKQESDDALAEASRELEALRDELARSQNLRDEFTRTQERLQASQSALTASTQALESAQSNHSAEMNQLNESHTAEIKQLQDSHAAEIKQLQDSHAAEIKQLQDSHAAEIAKLKASHTAEITHLQDSHSAESTQLKVSHSAEVTQLKGCLEDASSQLTHLNCQLDFASADAASFLEHRNLAESVISEKNSQLKTLQLTVSQAEEKCRLAEDELQKQRSQFQELDTEFRELLAFSNARDREAQEQILKLTSGAASNPSAPSVDALTPGVERRIQNLEGRLADTLQERDTLKEQLAQTKATLVSTEHHQQQENDSLTQRFASDALALLKQTLIAEKEKNTAARAASVNLQNSLHEGIQHLERVLAQDPSEISRAEQLEQKNERLIAKLQQEVESVRRHHQADMARAESNEKAMEGRYKALIQKETLLREKLSRFEQRTADYDSLTSQLRRKESALLSAEKEFEEARQQWQIIQASLQHRIDELEQGAGLLFDTQAHTLSSQNSTSDDHSFKIEPWMRRMHS